MAHGIELASELGVLDNLVPMLLGKGLERLLEPLAFFRHLIMGSGLGFRVWDLGSNFPDI